MNTISYIFKSFSWSVIARLLDAITKFFSIPLLINHLGTDTYGLLGLALSTNAFLQILNLGMNTGIVKFISQWISEKKFDLVDKVSRTNLTFYSVIGLVNGVVLVVLALFGDGVFKIDINQYETFKKMLILMSLFSVVNWLILAFQQILIADEKMGFTQKMLSYRSILDLVVVFIAIILKWTIIEYFVVYLIVNSLIIIPYIYVCLKNGLIKSLIPGFYLKEFSIVFKYSLSIFAFSVFQVISTQSRPIILGAFSNSGVGVVTEYKIIEVFPSFVIAIGGILTTILLPITAKLIQNNDKTRIELLAYQGTKLTSVLVALLSFPIMLVSSEILSLYVGPEYDHLSIWLSLWVFTLILYLHNTPIASLVLATGKTKMLILSTALASILSVTVNILLSNILYVGSAVIGYLIYIVIQMSFYYFYFNNKVLILNTKKIFNSFLVPTLIGLLCFIIIKIINVQLSSTLLQILFKVSAWFLIYIGILYYTKTLDFRKIFDSLPFHKK